MAKNTTVIAAGTEDTHDFCLDENGQIMMLSGLDAYAQIVNCNMRTILGEKQLDMASGLPYLQTIFADKSTIPIWVAEVQKMLENISFVKRVVTIDTSVEDGVLSYRSVIETDLGPLTQTGRVEAKTIRDKRLQRKEEEEAPAAYILSFNTGDGTPIAPMAVNPGTSVKLPSAVKDGYTFVGWYFDPLLEEPVTTFAMPTNSVTLYARYESFTRFLIDTGVLKSDDGMFYLRAWATPVIEYNLPEGDSKDRFQYTDGIQFTPSDLNIDTSTKINHLLIYISDMQGWPSNTTIGLSLRNEDNTEDEQTTYYNIENEISAGGYADIPVDGLRLINGRIYRIGFYDSNKTPIRRSLRVQSADESVSNNTRVYARPTTNWPTTPDWSYESTWCPVFKFTFVSSNKFVIDWGDGSVSSHSAVFLTNTRDVWGGTLISHKYEGGGIREIRITENCAAVKFGKSPTSTGGAEEYYQSSKDAVLSVVQWGIGIISVFRTFSMCRNFTSMNTSWGANIVNCDAVFENSGIRNVVKWPTGVTDIRFAYANCVNVTGKIPEIPESVVNCTGTFINCQSIIPTDGVDEEGYSDKIMPPRFSDLNLPRSGYVGGTANPIVRALYTSDWGGTKAEDQSLDLED